MELIHIKFNNYRNLDGLETSLKRDINFVVGENNLGKSNFQIGIFRSLSGKAFEEDDFTSLSEKIKVEMRFYLSDEEVGIFDDLVDPYDANAINITAEQDGPDDYLRYYHTETGEAIPASMIRKINVITYDSLRNPRNEIDFNKSKGAGAFLHYIVNKYITENGGKNILKPSEVKNVEKYIAGALGKMNVFSRFSISPKVEIDEQEIMSRILFLKDGNDIGVSNSGYGVQFNILIMLSLLEKIISFAKKKKEWEEVFSALLIFDEPEIHLHPYLQRTIIKDIIKLAKGEDEEFNALLSEYFGIKKISAQVVITTHSPNILGDDYENIIRMYRKEATTKAVSCAELRLQDKERKQLLMQFEYIKEAIFARAAIIVEGDSEYGAFKEFARKLEIDFDSQGIALIKAGGAESILPIISLLEKLGIKAVGVIDKDKKIEKHLPDCDNLFYTTSKCFDSEIVKRLIKIGNYEALKKILTEYDSAGEKRSFQKNKLNKVIEKYGYKRMLATRDYRFEELAETDDLFEVIYVTWFETNKGILLGKLIGCSLQKNDIPPCYIKAIRKVAKYSNE